jgi:hypothetical protein
MAKSILKLFALGVGVFMLPGCATEVGVEEGADLEVAEQALDSCRGTTAGKWQHLANLAVATAQEMGELNTSEQFTVGSSSVGNIVKLSTYGAAVCAERGGCPMVQALLDMQEMPNDVYVPQADFNTIDYRNTLVDGYGRQVMQIAAFTKNRAFSQLPEDHRTTFVGQDGTATCGSPWFSFSVKRDFHMKFSTNGPIADMSCTLINEPSDPNGWDNNYLCSERQIGLKWSHQGPISGMTCINFNEGADPDTWTDNHLCTPENWGLVFSRNGAVSGKKCISVAEPNDPHAWADNFLCWDAEANLNHPSTLCQEMLLFGGAAACNGNNPYIDFVVSSDQSSFKIDPTDYTSGTLSTGSTGSCITAIPYASTTDVTGKCCYSQNAGKYGTLVKYPFRPYTYVCKLP